MRQLFGAIRPFTAKQTWWSARFVLLSTDELQSGLHEIILALAFVTLLRFSSRFGMFNFLVFLL